MLDILGYSGIRLRSRSESGPVDASRGHPQDARYGCWRRGSRMDNGGSCRASGEASNIVGKMRLRGVERQASHTGCAAVRSGQCKKGRGRSTSPIRIVCTFVCTLAYSNPVYGQKILLGPSGRIPYTYWRIAKIGVRVVGSQSRRAQRVSQDHCADNNRTCIGRALGRILNRKAL